MDLYFIIKLIKNKLNSSKINYKTLLFLYILYLFLITMKDIKSKRNLMLYRSQIRLIILEKGQQKLLGNDFIQEPSSVLVNGISRDSSCKKKCTLEDFNLQIKKVTLILPKKVFNILYKVITLLLLYLKMKLSLAILYLMMSKMSHILICQILILLE